MAIITADTNLSAVTYAVGETIEIRNGATLTVDATPAIRPGIVQCLTSGRLLIEPANPAVPLIFELHDMNHDFRFEADGRFEVRGDPLSLAPGTGSAQTWDFTSLFGGVIRTLTYCEVETAPGSGVFMPWPIADEDPRFNQDPVAATVGGFGPSAFGAGNTPAGRVLFWHEGNRTLRSGDGSNSSVVPAGCAVRIPNVLISNRHATNATRFFNISTQGTPTGGSFTLEFTSEAGTVLGTTAAIPFNATSAQVDTAIEAVTGAGTVTPGGGPLPTAVSVTWAGALASAPPLVRVASSSLTGGTSPSVHCLENNAANLTLIDVTPLGTLDAEWCSFSHKIRLILSNFTKVRLVNVGLGADAWQINDSNGSVELDGVSHCQSPFAANLQRQISSVFGPVSVKRVVSLGKAPSALTFFALPAATGMDRLWSGFVNPRNSPGNRAILFQSLPTGIEIANLTAVGGGFSFTNVTEAVVTNIGYADGVGGVQTTTNATNVLNLFNAVDCVFAKVTDAGVMKSRSGVGLVPDAASSGNALFGAALDASNNADRLVFLAATNTTVQDVALSNLRSGPVIDTTPSWLANRARVRKVLVSSFGTAIAAAAVDASTGGQYDVATCPATNVNLAFAGVGDYVGGNFVDIGAAPTTGHVTFGPFGSGEGLVLGGAAYTDALGGVALPSAGDSFTATIPFAMHAITAMALSGSGLPIVHCQIVGPAIAANQHGIESDATGGSLTLTISDAAGTVLGTTAPIAFNASTTTWQTAIAAVPGIGTGNVSVGGGLTTVTGRTITFTAALAGQRFRVAVNGSALTGATTPGGAVAYARPVLRTGTEDVSPGLTIEFALREGGDDTWTAWRTLTTANLATSWGELPGTYDEFGTGLEARLRCTAVNAGALQLVSQISIPTTVDAAGWSPPDATIELQGPAPTDVTRMIRASDNVVLASWTGAGVREFSVGANFGTQVYFRRETAGGTVLMVTRPATQRVVYGVNPAVPLFYGAEVQLAQAQDVTVIRAAVDARLDVAVSSRLPANDPRVALIPGLV